MALLLKASKVIEGNPEELVIEAGQVIIGRLPSNHLVIPGSDVEPIHAMIEVDPQSGAASLVDMASEAGVRLNGRVIEVVEPLKAGDKIQIGDVRIDVLSGEGKVAAAAAATGAVGKTTPKETPEKNRAENVRTQKAGEAMGGSSQGRRSKRDDYRYEGQVKRVPTVNYGFLFEPGKERPHGSTLEVVAYWDQSILDVRHYGGNVKKGELPRPSQCVLGNEEDDQLIGIGPRANTRNYTFASVEGSSTVIYLNDEMKARVRRGGNFEKVAGPAKVKMKPGEMALVKHGPVSYFLTNVSLPNPILKRFEDLDGRPLIFIYALFLYGLLSSGMYYLNRDGIPEKPFDEDSWAETLAIRTPTPRPKDALPAPKPEVEVKKPEPVKPPVVKPPEKKPEPPKPSEPVKAPEVKPVAKDKPEPVKAPEAKPPVALQSPKKPTPPAPSNAGGVAKGETKANDKALGPKSSNNAGNGGGKAGGTSGAFAGARAGNSKSSAMGVEGGKKDVMSGINLDKLGAGLGKISDINGVGAIATGLQSSGGGAGGGSGSAGRGAHGFGGIGKGNSLSTGGPARALSGLGGGAGGLGAGGLGGAGGAGGPGAVGKIKASAVVVPEGDPAVEGSLTKEEIEAVIRANLAQIKACYERFLQGNRNLAGRVTTNFVIGGDGRVNSATIANSDLGSPGAEGCMAGAIRRWKFPLPRGGGVVSVKYPFVFNSR